MEMINFENLVIKFEGEKLPPINLIVNSQEVIGIESERDLYERALIEFFACENLDFEGNARIFDIDLSEINDDSIKIIRQNISILTLYYPLISNLKLIENVYLPHFFDSNEQEKKVFDKAYKILEYLGIEKKFNLNPAFLTNFEKKLVLLGRTLMNNYKIILISKYFSDLDESKKNFLVDKILEQKKINDTIAIIIIERNLDLLPRITFDKILKV